MYYGEGRGDSPLEGYDYGWADPPPILTDDRDFDYEASRWVPAFLVLPTETVRFSDATVEDLRLAAAVEAHKAASETTWEATFERLVRVWVFRWYAEREG